MPSPLANLAYLISNGVNKASSAATGYAQAGQEAEDTDQGNFKLKLGAIIGVVLITGVVLRRAYHALRERGYFGGHAPADDVAPDSPAVSPRHAAELRPLIDETSLRARRSPAGQDRAVEDNAAPAPRAATPEQPVSEHRVTINRTPTPEREDSPASVSHVARLNPIRLPSASSTPDLENGEGSPKSWSKVSRAEVESPLTPSWTDVSGSSRSATPLLGASSSSAPSR